jgi:hypothetical protein
MLAPDVERKRSRLSIPLFFCVLALAVSLLTAPVIYAGSDLSSSYQSSGDASPVTLQYFGLLSAYSAPFPAIPFGSWRADLAWKLVEPQRRGWDFSRSDWWVDQANAHNVEVLFILGYIPRWASSTPDKACRVGAGQCAEPSDLDEWRNYVRTVALRYKGRVHYYEMWNEPNDPQYYTGSITGMVKLTQAAQEVLKGVDPSIRLVSPSPVGPEGVKWLGEFLQAGGGKYSDIIGFHFYVAPGPPEGLVRLVQEIETLMAKNGVSDRPLWNTEIGWVGTKLDDFWQPAYLARTQLLLRSSGVSRSFWYAWGIRDGLVSLHLAKEDRVTPTPAGKAFEVLQSWMIGATVRSCTSADIPEPYKSSRGIWTCEISRSGEVSRVVWNSGGTVTFPVPPNWNVKRIGDLKGEYVTVPERRQIQVGEQPVILTGG